MRRQGVTMALTLLPLTEYSSKYKVSISTLRRRIKADDIRYAFRDGKYFIGDEPMSTHQGIQPAHRPSQASGPSLNPNDDSGEFSLAKASLESVQTTSSYAPAQTSHPFNAQNDEPILTAANRLLTELKKAYTQILQEKEEQILNLKEEVSDLKTLVRVLEADNERLQGCTIMTMP